MSDYSRGDYADLPAGTTDLENNYSAPDLTAIASNDNSTYANQTANNEIAIHQYKKTVTSQYTNILWSGKSSLAPSESPVILEVYNVDDTAWEELDRDDSTAADTDFDLSYDNLATADYLDSGVITWRVYQAASGAAPPEKIQIATNMAVPQRANRVALRTSAGVLYVIVNDQAALRCYKFTPGTPGSFAEMDSAHRPVGGFSFSAAIDSNDVIGVVLSVSTTIKYITFSSDTWANAGVPETVQTITNGETASDTVDLCFDSSNKAHVCYTDSTNYGYYTNRISGDWTKTPVLIEDTGLTAAYTSMTLNASGVPMISYGNVSGTRVCKAAIGDANDAASFTRQQLSTANGNDCISSIGMDSGGNVWVAYANTGGDTLRIIEKLAADGWDTWQTPVTLDGTSQNTYPSIAINGTNIYVFATKASTGIWYFNNVSGWSAGDLLESGATYDKCHARWSLLNNPSYATYGIDYLFEDTSNGTVYYNYKVI